jgi:ribosomal protein S27AE
MKSKEPNYYEVNGKPLSCPICSNKRFLARETLMNTPGMTIMGIEWANKAAQNYICDNCGYILWFMNK